MKKIALFLLFVPFLGIAQTQYWQQKVHYTMDFDLDVESNQYTGKQKVQYINQSPDVLNEVYFHLYFNAFQPNSMMDIRSRTVLDPDKRVGNRIAGLKADEIGFIQIPTLSQNGKILSTETIGTLLKVKTNPINPGDTVYFEMDVLAQVPKQIRRSGRDNKEGIRYTMTQWYPKMAVYDVDGWHIDQYIGREFYGEWGSFDVCITIDKDYILGGTGEVQNAGSFVNTDIHSYDLSPKSHYNQKRYSKDMSKNTWHFYAENVHDFAWAADPDFKHDVVEIPNTKQKLHFLYEDADEGWKTLQKDMPKVLQQAKVWFGDYPYPQYSFIQGGDGGMEYPMCTMVKGSSRGTAIHELMHSWYQGMLATNELWYEWMDEGFTTWSSTELEHYFGWQNSNTTYADHSGSVRSYKRINEYNLEEPLGTHADMYHTNMGYGVAAYSKGALFLENLSYIIGKEQTRKTLRAYYKKWAFKHPKPLDFIRIAEEISGVNLDHFFKNWTQTTKKIDYGIYQVSWEENTTRVTLIRKGQMPMPLELEVSLKDGRKFLYYIPLLQMYGRKQDFPLFEKVIQLQAVPWVSPVVNLELDFKAEEIERLKLFPNSFVPDIFLLDNEFDFKDLRVNKKAHYTLEIKQEKKKVKYRDSKGKKRKKWETTDYIHYRRD